MKESEGSLQLKLPVHFVLILTSLNQGICTLNHKV